MILKQEYSVKNELKTAFMELLSEKTYMDITITDIVKKAHVARVSFYRNFSSISDLVDAIADEMIKDFTLEIVPIFLSNDERKWREFLFHLFYQISRNEKHFFHGNPQNMSVIFSRIDEKMNELDHELSEHSIKNKYEIVGKIGLINQISRKWMTDGMQETPEEMVDYILSFITKF